MSVLHTLDILKLHAKLKAANAHGDDTFEIRDVIKEIPDHDPWAIINILKDLNMIEVIEKVVAPNPLVTAYYPSTYLFKAI